MSGETVVSNLPWYRQPLVQVEEADIVSDDVRTVPERETKCITNTNNAHSTGTVRTVMAADSHLKGRFDVNGRGMRCGLEEKYRYFNGLGFDVTIFDSKGLYWKIPYDPHNTTGTFEMACLITAGRGVTVNSKGVSSTTEGVMKERMLDRAINSGWHELGDAGGTRTCEWSSVIYQDELEHEDTLFVSSLNLFITTITNYRDAPFHPDAISKVEGRTYGDGITFGAFVNWNGGEKPPLYYVRICDKTRTLPVTQNPALPSGVFRFIRDGNRPITPTQVKANELGVTKFWHEIPIFDTSAEADVATSENIAGQLKMDAVERERISLDKMYAEHVAEKEQAEKTRLEEKEATEKTRKTLEEKLRLKDLDIAVEKREAERDVMAIKESSARRVTTREDESSWLKYVAGAVTIGLGLWSAFA